MRKYFSLDLLDWYYPSMTKNYQFARTFSRNADLLICRNNLRYNMRDNLPFVMLKHPVL